MTGRRRAAGDPAPGSRPGGALTAASGTPVAVDVSADRRTRHLWVVLLGGPLVWLAHFALTYLVAEAGCTGDGPGLDRFDPPVPRVFTVAATAIALLACAALGRRAWRQWRPAAQHHRDDDRGHQSPGETATMLGGIGLLLAGFSAAAVLLVGVMTPLLPGCGS
ncbi:MAG: hypothetical protein AB7W59_01405 [Acidimicrobiia bacterium]